MKKVSIPQFLGYQVRVHGLTARQYFILLIGAVVSASCWESFSSTQQSLAIACVITIVVGMLVLAFLRISGRAAEEWITIILIWAIQPEKLQGKAFQRAFHRIKTMSEGIIELDGGKYLAIMEVKGYYFSELEQEQQFEAFSEFLSGLSFSVSLRICMRVEANHESIIPSSNLPTSLRRLHAHYLSYKNEKMLAQPSRIITCFLILSAGKHAQCREYISAVLSGLGKAKLPCRLLSSEKEIMTFFNAQDETIAARFRAREIRFNTASGDHHYGAALVVSKLPGSLSIGWLAHFIQQQQEPYDLRLSFQPLDDQQITNQLERKAVQIGGALLVKGGQKRNNGVSRHITKHALKEVEALQERLILKQSHLLSITLTICVSAPSHTQLRIRMKNMRLQLRTLNIMATPLYFEHHLAFLSGIYGSNLLPSHAYLLPTEAAASFYPFLQIPHIGPGILLGATGRDLVSFDPEDRMNNNLAVLGIPGAGKSFFLKILSARLSFYPQISIIIIDIEGEYTKWAETVKAHQTILSAESLNMNPFSLNQTHSLREKLSFLVGLIGLLAGEQGELTQHEKAVVVSAVLKSYSDYGINDDPTTHSKTVPSIDDLLKNLQIEKAHELAYRLEIYRHIFPHSNKIDDIDTTHQVFNLHDLPTELRTIAMYLIIERLSSLLNENSKAKKHLIIIDEVWFLLKFRLGANFLNEFARRARKYNVGLWVGTQQVQDLLAEQQGNFKGLLDLCETKLLFRQEIDNLERLLKLNASEEKFLHNAGRGEALYLTSKERLMISVLASEQEQVFARGANT